MYPIVILTEYYNRFSKVLKMIDSNPSANGPNIFVRDSWSALGRKCKVKITIEHWKTIRYDNQIDPIKSPMFRAIIYKVKK